MLVNSLIASKLWYVSHIYPLPVEYVTLINQEIFTFIWGSNTNPIKRDTLYNSKYNGGIGLINISQKCKSILVNNVMKSFLCSDVNDLVRYYMIRKVGNLFNITREPNKVSKVNAPYYDYTVDLIKKCKDHRKFPNMKSKDIYDMLVPYSQPNIEFKYPNYDWGNIWKNLNFKYMNIVTRNIMYKYINEILPNNKRLKHIRSRDSTWCDYCINVEDSNIHRFYFCGKVQESLSFLRNVIYYICGVQIDSMIRILSLDIPKIENRNKNCLYILLSCYVSSVWLNRENIDNMKYIVKSNIIKTQRFHMQLLGRKADAIFSKNYCQLDIGIINTM